MTLDDIIASLNVISYYNPNMKSLHSDFIAEQSNALANQAAINEAEENGQRIYESLVVIQVGLANAIHDYVYNVIAPFESVMSKNIVREMVSRDVFGLPAEF